MVYTQMNTLKEKNRGDGVSNNRFTFYKNDKSFISEEPSQSAFITVEHCRLVESVGYLKKLLERTEPNGTTDRDRKCGCCHNHLGREHIKYMIDRLSRVIILTNPKENLTELKKIIRSVISCDELITVYNELVKSKNVV